MPHTDPEDPPRRRANARPGHGTWANDRPPVCGVVGRESVEIRLSVTERSDGETLDTGVCHMAFFSDPDGNDLMLHHRYKPYDG